MFSKMVYHLVNFWFKSIEIDIVYLSLSFGVCFTGIGQLETKIQPGEN